jgi:hypothetical protein
MWRSGVILIASKKSYALRVDEFDFEKLKIISNKNHRSINAQIEALISDCIEKYEKENGIISVNSPDKYDTNLKLYFEPEGSFEYNFNNNDETFQGSLKYTFGYYNATRNFLLLEQVEGDLIDRIIKSTDEIYFSYIIKLINTNFKIPYNHMSNKVDIFFNFQGKYKELEIGKKATKKSDHAEIVEALPRDNENISKWLGKSLSDRKDFWQKEIARIFTQKDE